MGNFQVKVNAFAVVVVKNVEDEDAALEAAIEMVDWGSFQSDEASVETKLEDDELEDACRHADMVITEDDDEEDAD